MTRIFRANARRFSAPTERTRRKRKKPRCSTMVLAEDIPEYQIIPSIAAVTGIINMLFRQSNSLLFTYTSIYGYSVHIQTSQAHRSQWQLNIDTIPCIIVPEKLSTYRYFVGFSPRDAHLVVFFWLLNGWTWSKYEGIFSHFTRGVAQLPYKK